MSHPDMVRVVYDYQPYLAVRRAHDGAVLAKLQSLVPGSPSLSAYDDTLAGS